MAPWALTKTLIGAWWWQVSGWQPATRYWTRGSTSCCVAPSSGRSTASPKSRPVSREAHSALPAGKSAPFKTQRKAMLIRFNRTPRGRHGTEQLLLQRMVCLFNSIFKKVEMKTLFSLGWWLWEPLCSCVWSAACGDPVWLQNGNSVFQISANVFITF